MEFDDNELKIIYDILSIGQYNIVHEIMKKIENHFNIKKEL